MNTKEDKKATTISIPDSILQTISARLLKRGIASCHSYQQIILLCLRQYLKENQPEDFEGRPTCQYNPESCSKQLKVFFSINEHYNLKLFRLALQISVSYLCCIAIDDCLDTILAMLEAGDANNISTENEDLEILFESLNATHRKIPLCKKNILRLVIVIPKPVKKQATFHSGHCGIPYRNGTSEVRSTH